MVSKNPASNAPRKSGNDDTSDEGEMFFEDALATLRSGTGARRLAWPEGQSARFADGKLLLKGADGNDSEWSPTVEDILAIDWEVV